MARPRADGAQAATHNRRKLNHLLLRRLKPGERPYLIWDANHDTRRLAVAVQPTGHASFKVIYPLHGRVRWYHVADVADISLEKARDVAKEVMGKVAQGQDPAAERRAARGAGTFEELATRYREYAKRKNKSWKQADHLIKRYLTPKWAKLPAASITRGDVKAALAKINGPILANQVLAATSAVFSWAVREEVGGIKVNPATGVERNKTISRERVLEDSEVPIFWKAFESAGLVRCLALRMLLLTG